MVRALFFGDVPHRLAGAQRSLLAALAALPATDIEPLAVFPAEGLCVDAYAKAVPTCVLPGPDAFQTFGKKLLRLSPAGKARIAFSQLIPYGLRFMRFLDEHRIDVVHFNTPRGALMVGWAARAARRPIVLHLRGVPPFSPLYTAMACAISSRIVVVANAIRSIVPRALDARVRVVYNGVDLAEPHDREAARKRLAARLDLDARRLEQEILFVTLASPVPIKGLHHLLAAAADLRQAGARARWIIAGHGPDALYEAYLQRLLDRLALRDVVHFLGFDPAPGMLLAAGDALVLSSVEKESLTFDDGTVRDVYGTEGLPRSILEAMASSLPVIATRVGGVDEEVEDGSSGILVAPSVPEALRCAMARAVEDPDWRRHAGVRGRAIAEEKFSVAASAEGLATALREAAAS